MNLAVAEEDINGSLENLGAEHVYGKKYKTSEVDGFEVKKLIRSPKESTEDATTAWTEETIASYLEPS